MNAQAASFRICNVSLAGAKFHDVNPGNIAITDANLDGMTIGRILVTELLCACKA